MKDSVTYQETVREGEVKNARQFIVRLGTKRFGTPPDAETRRRLEATEEIGTLESLFERVSDIKGWQELFE